MQCNRGILARSARNINSQVVTQQVIVPGLWKTEVLDTLIQASRRGRIRPDQVRQLWSQLELVGIRQSGYEPPATQIIDLCLKHSLTAYDASYLALALWARLPLATLDGQLANAATNESVTVLGH